MAEAQPNLTPFELVKADKAKVRNILKAQPNIFGNKGIIGLFSLLNSKTAAATLQNLAKQKLNLVLTPEEGFTTINPADKVQNFYGTVDMKATFKNVGERLLKQRINDIKNLDVSLNIKGAVIGEYYANLLKKQIPENLRNEVFEVVNQNFKFTKQEKYDFYINAYALTERMKVGNEVLPLFQKILGLSKNQLKKFKGDDAKALAKSGDDLKYDFESREKGKALYADGDTLRDQLQKLQAEKATAEAAPTAQVNTIALLKKMIKDKKVEIGADVAKTSAEAAQKKGKKELEKTQAMGKGNSYSNEELKDRLAELDSKETLTKNEEVIKATILKRIEGLRAEKIAREDRQKLIAEGPAETEGQRMERENIERERTYAEYKDTKQSEFFDSYIDQMTDQPRAQRLRDAILKFGSINDPNQQFKRNRYKGLLKKFANPRFNAQDREIAGDLATHIFFGQEKAKTGSTFQLTKKADELQTTNQQMKDRLAKIRSGLEKGGGFLRKFGLGKDEAEPKERPIRGVIESRLADRAASRERDLERIDTPYKRSQVAQEFLQSQRTEALGGGGAAGESESDRQQRVADTRAQRESDLQYDSGGPRVGAGNQGLISQADMDRDYPRRVRPALGTTAQINETARTTDRSAEFLRSRAAVGTTMRSLNFDTRLTNELSTQALEDGRTFRQERQNYMDTFEDYDLVEKDFETMANMRDQLQRDGGVSSNYRYINPTGAEGLTNILKADHRENQQILRDMRTDRLAGKHIVNVINNSFGNLFSVPTTTISEGQTYDLPPQSSYKIPTGEYYRNEEEEDVEIFDYIQGSMASVVRTELKDRVIYYGHYYGKNAEETGFMEGLGLETKDRRKGGTLALMTDLRDPRGLEERYKQGSLFGRRPPKFDDESVRYTEYEGQDLTALPEYQGLLVGKEGKRKQKGVAESRGYAGNKGKLQEIQGGSSGYKATAIVGQNTFLGYKNTRGRVKPIKPDEGLRTGEIFSEGYLSIADQLTKARLDRMKAQRKYNYAFMGSTPFGLGQGKARIRGRGDD